MAIVTMPGGLYLPAPYPTAGAAPAIGPATVMSTANHQNAVVFQVPKTGTLDWFEYRQNSNANTPDNGLRFAFQGVSASFAPDDTDDEFAVITAGFGANTWLVPPGYMGASGTASGAKRSVTKGDWLACVIKYESFVAGDSVAMTVASAYANFNSSLDSMIRYWTESTDGGTNWIKSQSYPTIALKYDDGTYAEIAWPWLPIQTINTRTFNSGSTPDERGLLFQVPVPTRISGMWVRVDLDNPADVVLYNAADSVIASFSLLTGMRAVSSAANARVMFATPVDLTPNVDYRLTILPTSGSSLSIYDFDVVSSAIRESIDGGATWMSTERTGAGAWTDVNTNRPLMGLILDGFDDGAGGGGGEHSAVF